MIPDKVIHKDWYRNTNSTDLFDPEIDISIEGYNRFYENFIEIKEDTRNSKVRGLFVGKLEPYQPSESWVIFTQTIL